MPKLIVKRKSTFIDMTAMSDVTVLLLTFFMLTSTFIQKEPVVATPSSVSEIKIPETNILSILVDPDGKVFMSLDKQEDKANVLKLLGKDFGINFTDKEVYDFSLQPSFGVPIQNMQEFLGMPSGEQDRLMKDYGIPADSTDNQFKLWVQHAREVNRDLVIAIKADQDTPYPKIKNIMNTLQDLRENRYNLITSLKKMPDNA